MKIETLSGKIDLYNPLTKDVAFADVILSLSHQCRYGGLIEKFYSVAEHSCHLHDYLLNVVKNERLAILGIMHELGETYLQDHISPIKRNLFVETYPNRLEKFDAVEMRLFKIMHKALFPNVPEFTEEEWAEFTEYDIAIVVDEWLTFRPNVPLPKSLSDVQPIDADLQGWTPVMAAIELERRMNRYM